MSTLLKALLVAGVGMTLNMAGAGMTLAAQEGNSPSPASKDSQSMDTQSNVSTPREGAANAATNQKDPGSTGPQRRNRDSTQQRGPATPGTGASSHSNPPGQTADAPAVHSDEQSANTPPANPGDPTDELRNRDSSKQEGNASRSLPEPTQKQN